jgi:hypothetical protein
MPVHAMAVALARIEAQRVIRQLLIDDFNQRAASSLPISSEE